MIEPAAPDFEFRRYSDRPLPAYRFIGGLNPHPVLDPRGHSYHVPEPNGAIEAHRLLQDWQSCETYRYGVDLYNFAYWWEAHECWEGIWKALPAGGGEKHALQAFIQVSAAHLKLHMRSPTGVQSLLRRARGHLDRVAGPTFRAFGLDAHAWWQDSVLPYFAAPTRRRFPFLEPHSGSNSCA